MATFRGIAGVVIFTGMATWIAAGLWGLLAGGALIIGAGTSYFVRVPRSLIAGVMSFGAGVLISALSFDLMEEAFRRGGFTATAIGFVSGAAVYTLADAILARHGAKHRKRSGPQHPSEQQSPGSGLAIAVGALLDGIPESIVLGVTMIQGGAISLAALAAVFLSNVPEGLSSAAGMKRAGRSPGYIFGVWGAIVVISGVASLLGFVVFRHFSEAVISATTAVAAGAILAMIADTMIPEAFEETRATAGFVTVVGFLAAFALTKLGG